MKVYVVITAGCAGVGCCQELVGVFAQAEAAAEAAAVYGGDGADVYPRELVGAAAAQEG